MKLKEVTKALILLGSIVLVTACSTGRKPQGDQYSVNEATAGDESAQTMGAGDEEKFSKYEGNNEKKVVAKNTYYFDFDSNVIHEDDKPAIQANASKLSAAASKVMLEGHTDPRGSREYNIGLGERRAKAVADYMRTNGVNPDQIRLVSYGSEKLAANGHSDEDYQRDRRVVLVNVK